MVIDIYQLLLLILIVILLIIIIIIGLNTLRETFVITGITGITY